jgi:cobalt-zinc-cadmium efflux system outer membrane protein
LNRRTIRSNYQTSRLSVSLRIALTPCAYDTSFGMPLAYQQDGSDHRTAAQRRSPIRSNCTRLEGIREFRRGKNVIRGFAFVIAVFLVRAELHSQTPLTLHDAIEQAEVSPLAHQGQDRVDVQRGYATQAGLRPNPRLYLQSEDIHPWDGNFDFANGTEDYGYLGQTFELDRKRAKRLVVADANVRRAEAEHALLEQQIASRVANAYWAAVTSARITKLLVDDVAAVDAMVRYHQDRVDAGAMRGVDLLRMQVERDRLVIALEAARREMLLARIELGRQMGRPLDAQVQLADSLDVTAPIATQTVSAVLAARPDVAAAREAVAAARADVTLQRALGVPDLDLLGGYKRNSGVDTLYSALQIQLPFRNRNQGEVQRANANLQLAQDQLQETELLVSAQVAAAEENYARQKEVVKSVLPDMRKHAQTNLSILSDAYKSGGIDLLRYLDAERTAIDVEVSAFRTLSEFQQSALQLTLAYGARP